MHSTLFYIFSAVAIGFALMVILLRNPITSALSLVGSFFGLSGIFVLLSAPFLSVIQILVYAGAILVLFLYVTMLLNINTVSSMGKHVTVSRATSLVGAVLLSAGILFIVRPHLHSAAEVPDTFGSIESIGSLLLGPAALLFELVSVVLLTSMIGVVVLGKKFEEGDPV